MRFICCRESAPSIFGARDDTIGAPDREAMMAKDNGDQQKPRYAIPPFTFALVCIGAAMMAVAAVLPYLEATGIFSRVKEAR